MPSATHELKSPAHPPRRSAPSSAPCALWAILGVTFLSSIGTGVITTGVYFLAQHAYRFSVAENYLLGLLQGVTYIAGALGAGPVLRRLRARTGLSARATLAGILLILAAAASLPVIGLAAGSGGKWAIWALVSLYSPLNGTLWPSIEAYLSGGRAGERLRSALGRFNVTWSSALVVGLVALGPMVEGHAVAAIGAVGLVHLATLLLLPFIGREPGRHLEDTHEPHPPVYRRLLLTFRLLLPASYIVSTALNPYLPTIFRDRLGIDTEWQTPLAATWTAARVLTFLTLERWHGWHGRWYPAVIGMTLVLAGFGLTVLSWRLGLVLAGLAAFGMGMATIYTGALYYAMEVGQSEVEAGGKHEALIGVGYTGGPTCGLLALGAVSAGWTDSFDSTVLMMVAGIAVAAAGTAAVRVRRRGPANTPP